MPVLLAPLDKPDAAQLRSAVIAARLAPRGPLAPRLAVGDVNANNWWTPVGSISELSLAISVLRELGEQWCFQHPFRHPRLIRLQASVQPNESDLEVLWTRAVSALAQEAEWDLTFVIVNRDGWWDPRSGHGHVWRRIRLNGERLARQPKA